MDTMASCVESTGAKHPEDRWSSAGLSLMPAFLKQPDEPCTLISAHERNAAIREGDWKLVGKNLPGRGGRPDGLLELYNLAREDSEQRNLEPGNFDLVEELHWKFPGDPGRTFVLPAP
jgi:hypothetical protein